MQPQKAAELQQWPSRRPLVPFLLDVASTDAASTGVFTVSRRRKPSGARAGHALKASEPSQQPLSFGSYACWSMQARMDASVPLGPGGGEGGMVVVSMAFGAVTPGGQHVYVPNGSPAHSPVGWAI